eukprot:6810709-Prymnesium_polylepis.1
MPDGGLTHAPWSIVPDPITCNATTAKHDTVEHHVDGTCPDPYGFIRKVASVKCHDRCTIDSQAGYVVSPNVTTIAQCIPPAE